MVTIASTPCAALLKKVVGGENLPHKKTLAFLQLQTMLPPVFDRIKGWWRFGLSCRRHDMQPWPGQETPAADPFPGVDGSRWYLFALAEVFQCLQGRTGAVQGKEFGG